MKTLIYQYWLGKGGVGVKAGIENMRAYAKMVGSDYKFTKNPTYMGKNINYFYHALEPIYNPQFYEKYDKILYIDTDIFAVDGLKESIFDVDIGHIATCRERHKEISHLTTKGPINKKEDEKWNTAMVKEYKKEMPRNEAGNLKIYNAGLVLYSQEGLNRAREKYTPFRDYMYFCRKHRLEAFYYDDQNYLQCMYQTANIDLTELDSGWNSFVHYGEHIDKTKPRPIVDTRTENTKFVHIQMKNTRDKPTEWHHTVTNKPVTDWKLD